MNISNVSLGASFYRWVVGIFFTLCTTAFTGISKRIGRQQCFFRRKTQLNYCKYWCFHPWIFCSVCPFGLVGNGNQSISGV